MEYLRTDTVSVGTLYRKDAKLSRGAGAYFCKHFVPVGAQGAVACRPCRCGVRRGACLLCRQPTLPFRTPQGGLPSLSPACPAFSLLSFPHPPAPFPAGRGRDYSFFMQGASPLASPGAEPMVRRKNDRKRLPMGSAGSQGEGGPGEMELSVASDGGV